MYSMNLKKKIGKVFTSKYVGTGPSSYEKRIYRAAVSQRLRNTGIEDWWSLLPWLVWHFGRRCICFFGARPANVVRGYFPSCC